MSAATSDVGSHAAGPVPMACPEALAVVGDRSSWDAVDLRNSRNIEGVEQGLSSVLTSSLAGISSFAARDDAALGLPHSPGPC